MMFCRFLTASLWVSLLWTKNVAANDRWIITNFSEKAQNQSMLFWIRHYFSNVFDEHKSELDPAKHEELNAVNARVQNLDALDQMPYAAIGKLFFFDTGNRRKPRSCTAYFVDDHVVMTAAHCIMGFDGRWRQDLVFLTNFGQRELDVYNIQCAIVPRSWAAHTGDALEYDYAMLRTTRPTLRGFLRLTEAGIDRSARIIGYSTKWATDLIEIHYHVGSHDEFAEIDDNPMGPGSSGSPWLNSKDEVFSLSSHYNYDQGEHLHDDEVAVHAKNHMHGPIVSDEMLEMLEFAALGCR